MRPGTDARGTFDCRAEEHPSSLCPVIAELLPLPVRREELRTVFFMQVRHWNWPSRQAHELFLLRLGVALDHVRRFCLLPCFAILAARPQDCCSMAQLKRCHAWPRLVTKADLEWEAGARNEQDTRAHTHTHAHVPLCAENSAGCELGVAPQGCLPHRHGTHQDTWVLGLQNCRS